MQFILTAYDGTDAEAPERRMKSRPAHLEKIAALKNKGIFVFGGAMLDDEGNMAGSVIVYEVEDRIMLDEVLKDEPYVVNGVWKKTEIRPFRQAK